MQGTVLKIRNRVAPAALRSLLRPGPRDGLVRLGSDYGGWWVPETSLRPGAVAYCAGAGEDITFDSELVKRGLTVRTFDPTPRAIRHVERYAPKGLRFVPVGWWDTSDTLRFYAPRDPSHVSHSAVNLQGTTNYFDAKVEPVHELARELGDNSVDIIKMDIEGAEYRVIDSLLDRGPMPSVLCVEFDQPQPFRRLLDTVRRLRGAGLPLRHIDRWNYTFARQ